MRGRTRPVQAPDMVEVTIFKQLGVSRRGMRTRVALVHFTGLAIETMDGSPKINPNEKYGRLTLQGSAAPDVLEQIEKEIIRRVTHGRLGDLTWQADFE